MILIGKEKGINVYSNQVISKKELDQEWLDLVAEAKKAGLTISEIRDFLNRETIPSGIVHELQEKNAL